MAETNTPRSYLDYLPDVLAMVEKANFAAAKALHQRRMQDVCYSIKAHHYWEAFEAFFPTEDSQYCLFCVEIISPEFCLRRHQGLCYLKERLAAEAAYRRRLLHEAAYRMLLLHEAFADDTSPCIGRSLYITLHMV